MPNWSDLLDDRSAQRTIARRKSMPGLADLLRGHAVSLRPAAVGINVKYETESSPDRRAEPSLEVVRNVLAASGSRQGFQDLRIEFFRKELHTAVGKDDERAAEVRRRQDRRSRARLVTA